MFILLWQYYYSSINFWNKDPCSKERKREISRYRQTNDSRSSTFESDLSRLMVGSQSVRRTETLCQIAEDERNVGVDISTYCFSSRHFAFVSAACFELSKPLTDQGNGTENLDELCYESIRLIFVFLSSSPLALSVCLLCLSPHFTLSSLLFYLLYFSLLSVSSLSTLLFSFPSLLFFLSICLSIYLFMCLSICLFIYLFSIYIIKQWCLPSISIFDMNHMS